MKLLAFIFKVQLVVFSYCSVKPNRLSVKEKIINNLECLLSEYKKEEVESIKTIRVYKTKTIKYNTLTKTIVIDKDKENKYKQGLPLYKYANSIGKEVFFSDGESKIDSANGIDSNKNKTSSQGGIALNNNNISSVNKIDVYNNNISSVNKIDTYNNNTGSDNKIDIGDNTTNSSDQINIDKNNILPNEDTIQLNVNEKSLETSSIRQNKHRNPQISSIEDTPSTKDPFDPAEPDMISVKENSDTAIQTKEETTQSIQTKEENTVQSKSNINKTNISSNITKPTLLRSLNSLGYNPPSKNLDAVLNKLSKIQPQYQIMFLSVLIFESSGLSQIEELACLKGSCTSTYNDGTGSTDKSYHGRGFIQLTWPANYRNAGKYLGLGDALVKNPESVSQDVNLAMDVSVYFWNEIVQKNIDVRNRNYGAVTKMVNGSIECTGQNIDKSKRRYEIYTKIAAILGEKDIAKENGCYN